jgi:hypothetical protein
LAVPPLKSFFLELGKSTVFEIAKFVRQMASRQCKPNCSASHKARKANHLEFLKHCTLASNVKAGDFVSLAVSFLAGRGAAMPTEQIGRRVLWELWATR